jgi:putative sigma-54 modulation protein
MQLQVKAVHFELREQHREHIDRRVQRFTYAREYLVDLALTLTRERSLFHAEASLHFRWGTITHLKVSGYDLIEAFDKLFDKVQAKATKEKSRITQVSHGEPHRAPSRG